MAKFQKGERVIFADDDGNKHRGKITDVLPKKKRAKVVTDTNQRLEVPVRRIRPSPDKVLILEARLDRNLKSRRLYGDMFRQWLSAYNVETLYERVHTVEDVRRFLAREGRDVSTLVIHVMCHGEDLPGRRRARLCLTLYKLDLVKDKNVFENLEGKIVIFSCCEIGDDIKAMEEIKQISQASAIISYRKSVLDSYTNLTEVLLYDRLINTRKHPRIIVDQIQKLLRDLGVRFTDINEKASKPVLVCV